MSAIIFLFTILFSEPSTDKNISRAVTDARRELSGYQIVTLKRGDDIWEFEPAANGANGVKARRIRGNKKTDFTIFAGAIGEVVGLTGTITDQKVNFIALGIASVSTDKSTIEYRTANVPLDDEATTESRWSRSEVLTDRPITSPFPFMGVWITHGDSLTFTLQNMERDRATLIETHHFIHHCIPGIGVVYSLDSFEHQMSVSKTPWEKR